MPQSVATDSSASARRISCSCRPRAAPACLDVDDQKQRVVTVCAHGRPTGEGVGFGRRRGGRRAHPGGAAAARLPPPAAPSSGNGGAAAPRLPVAVILRVASASTPRSSSRSTRSTLLRAGSCGRSPSSSRRANPPCRLITEYQPAGRSGQVLDEARRLDPLLVRDVAGAVSTSERRPAVAGLWSSSGPGRATISRPRRGARAGACRRSALPAAACRCWRTPARA